MQRYLSPILRVDFLYKFSSVKKRTEQAAKIVEDYTSKVIEERRNYLKTLKEAESFGDVEENNNVGLRRKNMAFIDTLLKAQEENRCLMTDKDIRDQVSTFKAAGNDTVTAASCWTLLIKGTYPEIQKKVVDELHQVFGSSKRAPTMNDLAELKYLERCIKETLRLYSTFPFFKRQIREYIHFHDGLVAPAGVTASINLFMLHRDPEHFPDPERFDPDRFLPENCARRHPHSYLPFSAGPRNCIGQKFALLEGNAVVSTVLRHLEVEAAQSIDEVKIEHQVALVMKPQNGLKVRLRDRGADDLKLRLN
ncbi:cytochrome P450 4C1-like [Cloeon dipterum]|uniref:cytochrome P450 4C1-like n=1 Tax=Cloeon dipterum TaxID=197152 RepID=UPI00321F9C3B